MGTQVARLADIDTGIIIREVPAITLEVNDQGQCIDSGPLDAALDAYLADHPKRNVAGVWEGSYWTYVRCVD